MENNANNTIDFNGLASKINTLSAKKTSLETEMATLNGERASLESQLKASLGEDYMTGFNNLVAKLSAFESAVLPV